MFFLKKVRVIGSILLSSCLYAHITIPFNFSSQVHHQELPLKRMHTLCMEVWGSIDAGVNDPEQASTFSNTFMFLLSRVLLVHSMFDILNVSLSTIMNDNPEQYDHILKELEHLYNVLYDARNTFSQCVSSKNTHSYAIDHVLEVVLQKMHFILQTRLIISPYYAFKYIFQPKAITPLLVPTYMLPVAPIG